MNITINFVSKEKFISSISESKEDRFAKTFAAKCNMMDIWEDCVGIFEDNNLACAMVLTISKRQPKVANIQLIHTFANFRFKGYAKKLTLTIIDSYLSEIKYLRVSSEKSAVGFYKKLGFKFLGVQKSGTLLSMCKVVGNNIGEFEFDKNDPIISRELNKKGKGGCIEIF